jgi:hypothetical protein
MITPEILSIVEQVLILYYSLAGASTGENPESIMQPFPLLHSPWYIIGGGI